MRVVTLGDLLLDVVVRLEAPPASDDDVPASIALVPGGQAANVAAWVCWLGGEARLIARRADDPAGRLIAAEIELLGVELAGPVIEGATTGTVVALVAPDGARTLASDRGAAGALAPGDVGAGMLAGADVLHVAGYTLLREAGIPGGRAAGRGGTPLRCSRDGRPLDGARDRAARSRRDAAAGARARARRRVRE